MTKKDYIVIAGALRSSRKFLELNSEVSNKQLFDNVVYALQVELRNQNIRFDDDKFVKFVYDL